MRTLGNYIVRGWWQAVGVVSVLALLSLLLPPLAYILSGVPVALVTLRRGPVTGIQVVFGALFLTSLLAWLAGLTVMLAPAFALAIWAPVWLCAMVLRLTESQGRMVVAAGGLAAAFAIFMHALVADVEDWWRSQFDAWLSGNLDPAAADQYRKLFEEAMPLMNAMMAAGLLLSLVVTVILARWWQSLLFNPGGFRAEFQNLTLPRGLAVAAVLAMILSLMETGAWHWFFRDMLIVLVFMYLFQGLASVHRTVYRRELSQGWLIGMYVLMLLMPQMALLVACVGMVDAWLGGQKSLP
ncbi:MAG: DUF2232 domain-containing protein [Gammaproteobacteria bacterium]